MWLSREVFCAQAKMASEIDSTDVPARLFAVVVAILIAWRYEHAHLIPWFAAFFILNEGSFEYLRRRIPENEQHLSLGLLIALTLRPPVSLVCWFALLFAITSIPTQGALVASILFMAAIILNSFVGHGLLPLFPWINMVATLPGVGAVGYVVVTLDRAPILPGEAEFIAFLFVFYGIGAITALGRQSQTRHTYADAMRIARNHLDELDKLARRDSLTGIMNRFAFDECLSAAIKEHDDLAVMVIDLNKFKPVNDTYGHAAGDEVLKVMAQRLTQILPANQVGRMGGDEFAAFLTGPAIRDAAKIVQRIKTALTLPIPYEGETIEAGAAVGLALRSSPKESPDALYSRADHDMYLNKSGHAR